MPKAKGGAGSKASPLHNVMTCCDTSPHNLSQAKSLFFNDNDGCDGIDSYLKSIENPATPTRVKCLVTV